MDLKIHKLFRNLPISLRILGGFLCLCGALTVISATVYYNRSRQVVIDSIRGQAVTLCEYAGHKFDMHYATPIEHELRLLAASPELDNYLQSPRDELLVRRAEVEKLFVRLSRGQDLYRSTTFLDQHGQETIGLSGNTRLRTFRSLAQIEADGPLGRHTAELFRRLQSSRTPAPVYTVPFYDAEHRLGILVGIAKQEPEAGGFGGALIRHCELTAFVQEVARNRILDTAVMWVYGSDGENLLAPPAEEVRQDPRPYLLHEETQTGSYVYTAACNLLAGDKPVLTVVCSVPPQVISKKLEPMVGSVALIFSVLLAGAGASSWLISRWVSQPLQKLTRAVRNVSAEKLELDLDVRLTEAKDEIGLLAGAFRKILSDLKDSTTSNDNLSREIVQRMKIEAELRLSERQQAQLLQQLSDINKELKEFAYIVSHDLKAPLRAIKTLAEWLATDYQDKLDEQGKESLRMLGQRVERMHNLIDGVLQYSRVGRTEQQAIAVDLNQLLPELVGDLAVPAHITVHVPPDLPMVEGDPTRLRQVFQNLLSNAIKYMDKPQGNITIGCVPENGFWKFSVADNGPGIEQKYFERIFKLFQTLARRDDCESTGVGLTVAKKIVELYGGKIWLESQVGQGTTFFFTLPQQSPKAADEALQPCAAEA